MTLLERSSTYKTTILPNNTRDRERGTSAGRGGIINGVTTQNTNRERKSEIKGKEHKKERIFYFIFIFLQQTEK